MILENRQWADPGYYGISNQDQKSVCRPINDLVTSFSQDGRPGNQRPGLNQLNSVVPTELGLGPECPTLEKSLNVLKAKVGLSYRDFTVANVMQLFESGVSLPGLRKLEFGWDGALRRLAEIAAVEGYLQNTQHTFKETSGRMLKALLVVLIDVTSTHLPFLGTS